MHCNVTGRLENSQPRHLSQAESALYSEVERLSSAWETLDRELKNKIFDLATMEDKVNKALADVRIEYHLSCRSD